jgi:signal peptidase
MKVLKKVLNIIIDIIIILVLIVSAIILTYSLTSQDTGTPNLFGYTINAIQSGSMEPEFYKGDLLIGKTTSSNTQYAKGDIVFFESKYTDDDGTDYLMVKCHRIIDTKVIAGETTYLTKGDNNDDTDASEDGWLTSKKIVGVYENSDYKGTKIDGLGTVIDFLQSFWGFFFVIVLPMIIFFIYELIRVILNLMAYSKEKALVAAQEAAQSAELSEQQKQKAIEEYLAQQAEKEKQAQSQNDSAD